MDWPHISEGSPYQPRPGFGGPLSTLSLHRVKQEAAIFVCLLCATLGMGKLLYLSVQTTVLILPEVLDSTRPIRAPRLTSVHFVLSRKEDLWHLPAKAAVSNLPQMARLCWIHHSSKTYKTETSLLGAPWEIPGCWMHKPNSPFPRRNWEFGGLLLIVWHCAGSRDSGEKGSWNSLLALVSLVSFSPRVQEPFN